MSNTLARTPLYEEHVKAGARLVPFAGYEMPVQYPTGVMTEHNWTRQHAGLFDVSHMGQCVIVGDSFETVARAIERLMPADIVALEPGQQRYSQLLNAEGGILDDLMITRSERDGELYVVVNAGCKAQDYAHFTTHLPAGVRLNIRHDLALQALQGPEAEAVLSTLNPAVSNLAFMASGGFDLAGLTAHVSRSGYTGEDGFEISIAAIDAPALWARLLTDTRAKPIGLGARDSLRLEAGLCLYGHDIDVTTSPIEAGLLWSIGKRRRSEGGFFGAERFQAEVANGTKRKRVGIQPQSKAPAREGTQVQAMDGRSIGIITSGGFGPTVNGPVAMGYVDVASSLIGTDVQLIVRDKALPASIVKLPFVPNRFKR
jgi:aminomethyltransferase